MLSERKKKILEAVINENIKSAEPVSSKELQERFFNSVSSATIRNDLSALEEMGYLFSPHTSSGRLPTVTGFKKYIEELMGEKELTKEETESLKQNFNKKISGVEDLAQTVAKAISDVAGYASVVEIGLVKDATIESVKLVSITENMILVVLVTDLGVIKDLTITLENGISEDDAFVASSLLTTTLAGLSLKEVSGLDSLKLIEQTTDKYRELFKLVIDVILERKEKPVKKMEGAVKLLSEPEYKSAEGAKQAMKIFESTELLTPLAEAGSDLEVSIKVGLAEDNTCSVVSASYKLNGKNIGRAGVIGPVRMDYAKAVSVLKEVSETISTGMKGLLPHKNTNNEYKRRTNNGRRKGRRMRSPNNGKTEKGNN